MIHSRMILLVDHSHNIINSIYRCYYGFKNKNIYELVPGFKIVGYIISKNYV